MSLTSLRAKDQILAGSYDLGIKKEVKAASTANIDLTTGGLLTIDGVSLSADDRVLVKNQTSGEENGIYLAKSGSWIRAEDADETAEVFGGEITVVLEGTANGKSLWINSTIGTITVGTTVQTFEKLSSLGALLISKYIVREIPTGSINGSNTIFTLANTPVANSEMVFIRGVLQNSGAGNDYTISGNTITFARPPRSLPGNADTILVTYIAA